MTRGWTACVKANPTSQQVCGSLVLKAVTIYLEWMNQQGNVRRGVFRLFADGQKVMAATAQMPLWLKRQST
jgi:hypothetical protein